MIFRKLSNLIKDCKILKTLKQRENFEKEVENLVEECISNYPDFSIKYNEENKKQLELNNQDIKTIIAQLIPINEDIYPENEYPMLKYFNLTKYKTREDLINHMDNNQNYPLLNQILLDKPEMRKMKYLPIFNEFTNFMVDNYSFKISRDDAKKKILGKEEIFDDKQFRQKFEEFKEAWTNIKSEAIKYKCRDEMPPIDLTEEKPLINFLIDDGEWANGMYLSSADQNFISWQNSFVQPIIDSVAHDGILHYYVNNLKKKIPIYTAKINQTLLLEDSFKKSEYLNFNDLIYNFSRREIFKRDGTINYLGYNSFKYDFEKIEEEFGRILLPGICLFENEDNLNFVTYWSEVYRGGKSDTLISFYEKYPQNDLEEEEM
jgi:hypothetical protein